MTSHEDSNNVMFECRSFIYDHGPAYQGNVSLVCMSSKKRNANFTLNLCATCTISHCNYLSNEARNVSAPFQSSFGASLFDIVAFKGLLIFMPIWGELFAFEPFESEHDEAFLYTGHVRGAKLFLPKAF